MHPLCLSVLVLACLLPVAFSAGSSVEWCYHLPSCNDSTWPVIAAHFCNGSRQSPINIKASLKLKQMTPFLQKFTFTGFNDEAAMFKIKNTGKTVKVEFKAGTLKVSGGGLSTAYDSLQFHLHWGNLSSPGSEHTVDGKRYPMELHIVNAKSIYNGNIAKILQDSEGLAALGFFIEVESGTTDQPASWRNLTAHLGSITEKGQYADITGISMDDLISGVDTTSYYRYLGSLTTPNCNEAVVWTVFKNSIKVSKNLIDLFSTTVRVGNSSSPFMTNVYRSVQFLNGR
ncbi:carbonic anhydrase 6-like [Alosa pseudoharengus]|uniref:carbonic anhydrase 6-like n=1 Tax=Alosa pseudoharengus TaxID=34774 RepID=UPI003F8B34C7